MGMINRAGLFTANRVIPQLKMGLTRAKVKVSDFTQNHPALSSFLLLNAAALPAILPLAFMNAQAAPVLAVGMVQSTGEEKTDGEELPAYLIDLKERVSQSADLDRWRIIGRSGEREEIIQRVTSPRGMTSMVVVGKAGVGKTTVARALAYYGVVENGEGVEEFRGRPIVELDKAKLFGSIGSKPELSEELSQVMEWLRKNKAICIVDEICSVDPTFDPIFFGALLSAAAETDPDRRVTIIGTTTPEQYKQRFEDDSTGLKRRFPPVMIEEPPFAENLRFMLDFSRAWIKQTAIKITTKALRMVCKLNQRHTPDQSSPDRDINLMDKAAAWLQQEPSRRRRALEDAKREILASCNAAISVRDAEDDESVEMIDLSIKEAIQRYLEFAREAREPIPDEVNEKVIARLFSEATGIPVGELNQEQKKRILRIRDYLSERIIGQEMAREAVSKAVIRNAAKTVKEGAVKGVFLFLGPTGVGKTELSRTLSKFLFSSDANFVKIDMGEFGSEHMVSRLIGSPPGYRNSGEPGQFEPVRRKKHCVVVLDEVEKADQSVYKILLSILDQGYMTDGMGRRIYFNEAYVIMTSNLGSGDMREVYQKIQESYKEEIETLKRSAQNAREMLSKEDGDRHWTEGLKTAEDRREQSIKQAYLKCQEIGSKAVSQFFTPEQIGRIGKDNLIVFESFVKKQMEALFEIHQKMVCEPAYEAGYHLEFSDAAKKKIIDKGFDPELGARPLMQAIERLVGDPLAEAQVMDEYSDGSEMVLGDTIVVDVEDGEIVLKKGEPGKYKAPDISLSKREQEVFDQLDALITQRVDEEEEIEVDEIDEILNPRIKPALTPAGFDIKMSVDLNGFFPGETDAGLKSVIAPVFARVDKAKGKPLAKAVRTFIKRAAAIAKQSTSARLDDLVAKSPIPRSNPKIKSFDDIRKNYDTVEIREELVASLMMDLDSPPVPVQVSHGGEDSIDIQITDVNRLPAETASKLGRLFAMTPANTAESSRMGREEGFDSGLIEMLEALRVIRGLGGETNFWTEDGKTIIWLRIPAKESE